MCWDSSSNLFLCDTGNGKIKRIGTSGRLTHVIPPPPSDDHALQSMWIHRIRPEGVCMDNKGNMIFTDSVQHCVRRMTPEGHVSILAGIPRQAGFKDGDAHGALFNAPIGVACETRTGAVFVADSENHAIRMITAKGRVVTIAGGGVMPAAAVAASSASALSSGSAQRPSSASTQRSYSGRPPPAPVAPALSLSASTSPSESIEPQEGFVDGPAALARFFRPRGLVFDSAASVLYVVDTGNHAVRSIRIEHDRQEEETRVLHCFAELAVDEAAAATADSTSLDSARQLHAMLQSHASAAGMSRHASMPSFHAPLSVAPVPARPSSSESMGPLARQAASSSIALQALQSLALPSDVRSWSRIDVAFWLLGLNQAFEPYVTLFHANKIDGDALLEKCCTEAYLNEIGVSSKMHRNQILREVLRLKNPGESFSESPRSDEVGVAPGSARSEGSDGSFTARAGSRSNSVSSLRPSSARPGTASGWRPSSASNAVVESIVNGLPAANHASTAAPTGAAVAAPATSSSN
jgi:hypothetical protein